MQVKILEDIMKNSILISSIIAFFSGSLISLASPGDIAAEFSTPGICPTGLAFDGKYLWCADRLTDSLYALNPADGKVVKSLAAPGFIPLGLAVEKNYLWVLDGEANRLHKIDLKTGVTVNNFETPAINPQSLAFDGKDLWLADEKTDKLLQLSPDDGTMIKEFKTPAGSTSGLTWDGKYLWCADRLEDRIYMMEMQSGEVLLSFSSPGKYARGLAYVEGFLWNVDYQSDKLFKLVIDDGVKFTSTGQKIQQLTFYHEFRNYGPGQVDNVDIYFALPLDRPNQKILGDFIFDPAPKDFVTDRWGQKFAHFQHINPPLAQRNFVKMTVKAEISEVRWFVFPDKVGSMKDIPAEIKTKYLVDEDKYRIADPVIQNAVKEAVGGETNPYRIMRKIYKYVRDHLFYELSGGWNVAPAILIRGNGSCSEYSFVFISMCRAAGLPAKYVGSVVIRGDDASADDVFHRWCECYIPGYGWIPVDPSGGDQDTPGKAADYFGHIANRYLITTDGGGASEYLGWEYNAYEFYQSQGPVKVYIEKVGEWTPVE